MLNMMGNGNKERGAMMGTCRQSAMQYIIESLNGGNPMEAKPLGDPSPSNLKDVGGAVMRALQSGDVEAFTAAMQRFIVAVEELEEESEEDPFDLEVE